MFCVPSWGQHDDFPSLGVTRWDVVSRMRRQASRMGADSLNQRYLPPLPCPLYKKAVLCGQDWTKPSLRKDFISGFNFPAFSIPAFSINSH